MLHLYPLLHIHSLYTWKPTDGNSIILNTWLPVTLGVSILVSRTGTNKESVMGESV